MSKKNLEELQSVLNKFEEVVKSFKLVWKSVKSLQVIDRRFLARNMQDL